MTDQPIGAYRRLPALCSPWDPRAVAVAQRLGELITRACPQLAVEHVGSSSVPGCAGKGVIDLLVLYRPGGAGLESAKAALDGLGFQRQSSQNPFPEDRPMRVGAYAYGGESFRIHAHVLAADSGEAEEFTAFRDALRADARLREAYEAEKRSILAGGISDSAAYSEVKGGFIQRWLASRRTR